MVRPHGLKGEVIVSLSTNRNERLGPGSVLTTHEGRDLRVTMASPHKGRYIVAFEGVDGIDAAEGLRGTALVRPTARRSERTLGARAHRVAGRGR